MMKEEVRGILGWLAVLLAASAILTGIVALAMWASSAPAPGEMTSVERFHRVCEEHGGFVADTGGSFWSNRIDCIKDNRIIYLPGFA
jgi:hypothetical protein